MQITSHQGLSLRSHEYAAALFAESQRAADDQFGNRGPICKKGTAASGKRACKVRKTT